MAQVPLAAQLGQEMAVVVEREGAGKAQELRRVDRKATVISCQSDASDNNAFKFDASFNLFRVIYCA